MIPNELDERLGKIELRCKPDKEEWITLDVSLNKLLIQAKKIETKSEFLENLAIDKQQQHQIHKESYRQMSHWIDQLMGDKVKIEVCKQSYTPNALILAETGVTESRDHDSDRGGLNYKTQLSLFHVLRNLGYDCDLEVEARFRYFQIVVPVKNDKEFGNLLSDVRKVSLRKESSDIYDGLKRCFPNADTDRIENLCSKIVNSFPNPFRAIDDTYTGIVFPFKDPSTEEIAYCKVSAFLDMLAKEAEFLIDASKEELMYPITPKLIGIVSDGELSALLTSGTENGIEDSRALPYLTKRHDAYLALSKRTGLDLEQIQKDPFMEDAFNRAVSLFCMAKYKNKKIYKKANLPSFSSWSEIIGMLHTAQAPSELKSLILPNEVEYEERRDRVETYEKKAPTFLINGDGRPENIYASKKFRPLGDAGLAKEGMAELDVGKFEARDMKKYSFANNFFMQFLTGEEKLDSEIEPFQKAVDDVAYLNAEKLACFKAKKGRIAEAISYAKLANHYSEVNR